MPGIFIFKNTLCSCEGEGVYDDDAQNLIVNTNVYVPLAIQTTEK